MNLRNKLAIVGLTGAVFTGGVLGLSSLASAQTPTTGGSAEAEQVEQADDTVEGEVYADELSEADLQILEGFEACLVDAGVELYDEPTSVVMAVEVDGDDVAFEECEAELGDDWELDLDLSEEDEAIFEKYEECFDNIEGLYTEGDLHVEDDKEWTDADFEKFEAAAESCDEILDGLSFDIDEAFVIDGEIEEFEGDWEEFEGDWDEFEGEAFELELSEEDQAVFERFDGCIAEASGIDLEGDAELTDEDFERLEGAFEDCEEILEDLSEGELFYFGQDDFGDDDFEHDADFGHDADADYGETVETLDA